MEWWGFSLEHGWVFLDRSIPCNQPNSYAKLIFINCNTGEPFFEERKKWNRPDYIFEKRYIEESTDSSELLSNEIEKIKESLPIFKDASLKEWEKIKPALTNSSQDLHSNYEWLSGSFYSLSPEKRIESAKLAHSNFLTRIGKPFLGYVDGSKPHYRRVTHCYSCKRTLDNSLDIECKACAWIICPCGACGCGWGGRF